VLSVFNAAVKLQEVLHTFQSRKYVIGALERHGVEE